MLRYFVSGETATRCHMHTVNKIIQAIMLLDSGLKNLDSRIWTQESGLWTPGPKRGVTKFWRLFSSVQISDGLS
jgi:hypothetical protein